MSSLRWILLLTVALAGCASDATEPPSSTPASTSPGYVRDLPPAEFDEYLRRHPDAFVLDVRQAIEWDDDLGHLETAVQIPLEDLETRAGDLPSDKLRPVVVYDRLDVRSATAARRIAQMGFREVVNLQGGLSAYRRAGH